MPNPIFRACALLAQTAQTMPRGGIMDLDKTLLVKIAIQWLNVLLLTAALIYILYNPVKAFMAARAGRIAQSIVNARRDEAEAAALKSEYEQRLADIDREREEILGQTHRAAALKSESLLQAARQQAEAIVQKAEADIRADREAAADDVKRQILELSVLMAERFVTLSIDAETQRRYIDEALAAWSEQTWQA